MIVDLSDKSIDHLFRGVMVLFDVLRVLSITFQCMHDNVCMRHKATDHLCRGVMVLFDVLRVLSITFQCMHDNVCM
jgi:xylose isomerase